MFDSEVRSSERRSPQRWGQPSADPLFRAWKTSPAQGDLGGPEPPPPAPGALTHPPQLPASPSASFSSTRSHHVCHPSTEITAECLVGPRESGRAAEERAPRLGTSSTWPACTSLIHRVFITLAGMDDEWSAWVIYQQSILASLPTSSRLATSLHPTGLAPTWQVAPLAMVFGLSGYITSVGDNYNGSGTASAWSFIYLFLYGRDSWKYTFSRPSKLRTSIFPISLTGLALTNGLVHGYVYWTGFYRDKLKDDLEQETTSKAWLSWCLGWWLFRQTTRSESESDWAYWVQTKAL